MRKFSFSTASCSLSPSQVARWPSSDGGRQGRSFRWLKPVWMSVVSWRRADVVECLGLKLQSLFIGVQKLTVAGAEL